MSKIIFFCSVVRNIKSKFIVNSIQLVNDIGFWFSSVDLDFCWLLNAIYRIELSFVVREIFEFICKLLATFKLNFIRNAHADPTTLNAMNKLV